jgi:ABC-2 type transport system permease protein
MRTIGILARQVLRIVAKEKSTLFWMLAAPCLYISVFGYAFRQQGDPSKATASLAVLNEDGGYLSSRLIRSIRSENISIDSLKRRPDDTPFRLLVIPAGFTDKVLRGEKIVLTIDRRPDANTQAEQTAVMGIRKAAYRLLAELTEMSVSGGKADPRRFEALDRREPLIRVDASHAGNRRIIPTGFSQQVPANLVQFGLIFILIYAGTSVLDERKHGLLRRIRIGPVGFGHVFTGKLLGTTVLALTQALLLLGIGRFVFGVYYGNSPAGLALLVLAFSVCVASMGLCLGFAMKQHEKLVGVAVFSSLLMSALSGCWWPLEISPPWMQRLALALPSGIALRGLHLLISYGKGFGAVWPHALGLSAYAAGFAVLFSVLLKRRKEG